MRDNSQIDAVRKYLETHKRGITSMDAIRMFGATRLSSIIYVLRHRDHMKIGKSTELVKNRYGHTTRIVTYKLCD